MTQGRLRLFLTLSSLIFAFQLTSCGCKKPLPAGPTDGTGTGTGGGGTGTGTGTGEGGGTDTDTGGEGGGTDTGGGGEGGGDGARAAVLAPGSSSYDRYEGTSFQNACGTDGDCVTGGCSGEVCAAEEVVSTCEVQLATPKGACGCVDGLCIWYSGN